MLTQSDDQSASVLKTIWPKELPIENFLNMHHCALLQGNKLSLVYEWKLLLYDTQHYTKWLNLISWLVVLHTHATRIALVIP